ncbi:MAG: DEAD/DEAH box helicase family protein [Desulfosporosinus sp.]
MDYQQLSAEYNKLLEENAVLKKENSEFRKLLLLPEQVVEVHDTPIIISNEPSISNYSTAKEKIELFMSLFKGRDDVYAKRWYSLKTQKSGYQPACKNEWNDDLCDKRKYKCNSCPNRKLLILNENVIENHLRGKDAYGRDVIGLYPMLSDENCLLLAIDFDGEGYEKDVSAFVKVCQEKEIPAYIERSRSGNGAHIWIFFNEPIPSCLARRLGSILLTYAMNKRSEIKFISYDRLFPNQDTMPAGGFGNLIALPLQGLARKSGNSVFVDENFMPYKDQWVFLSNMQKMSLSQVKKHVSEIVGAGDLGTLIQDNTETENRPWEKQKVQYALAAVDFPKIIHITRANMVYIEKDGISQAARNTIKRLGAFKNPDFYKSQAMRLSTHDKPRIISTSEETEYFIAIPRGCERDLLEMLDEVKAKYEIMDETNIGKRIEVSFIGELREEQQPAAKALLQNSTGVLSATTAFGKTVIGANIIASRKVNTLILVHTQALLGQWKKSLEQFLGFDYELPEQPQKRGRKKTQSVIGELGAGKNSLNGIVDIAVMQSLISGDSVKDLVRDYGQIIVDECHHVSAVNFEKILKYANAKYVHGLTATPTRSDGHHPIIFMQCGDICYKVDARDQAEKRPFEHFVIPRFTSFRETSLNNEKGIAKIYNALAENEMRNEFIVNDVVSTLNHGRNPIILTERSEQVITFAKMLDGKCDHVISLVGSMAAKEKREAMKKLQALETGSRFVIIATGKYVGEGFDFPRLDTLFLAMPIAWKGKVAQYAGRLNRLYAGKEEVLIYDYVDVHIPVLERMYHKRIKGYAAIGYKIRADAQDIQKMNIIYNGESFLSVFDNDIVSAKKSIIIVSPYMRKGRIKQMVKILSKAVINKTSITVYTRPPKDFKETEQLSVIQNTEYLREANINVEYKPNIHQQFAIVDENIVWYGSVKFLCFNSLEDSVIRLESYDIAGELLGIL